MRFVFYMLLLFVVCLYSCTDDRAPSGISSTVLYGEGDCMPPVNEASRVYSPYTGRVYIIEKSTADTMLNFLDTTNNSIYTVHAEQGEFSILVPAGSYYVMPDTLFYVSAENLVTVNPDDLIQREFKFFRCTSY